MMNDIIIMDWGEDFPPFSTCPSDKPQLLYCHYKKSEDTILIDRLNPKNTKRLIDIVEYAIVHETIHCILYNFAEGNKYDKTRFSNFLDCKLISLALRDVFFNE